VLLASWTDQAPVTAIKPDLSRSAADNCGEWVKAC
jgi:D-alanyl-D-alanine carboxypeptidase/D-alanyl-D-alanine-endopeptidase (penicillin-binding protein 4)